MTEFRNAISCKKSSRLRRRRPLSSHGIIRHPTRLPLGAPRPVRLVREMRLSNGKLYSGAGPGPLAGAAAGPPGAGGGPSDMGPGPQRLLDDPLGANVSSTPPPAAPAPMLPSAPPRGCTHVRVCQECRRIQSLRSASSSCSRITPLASATSSLPRLPPPPPPSSSNTNTDSEGGGSASPHLPKPKPTPPPRPLPPTKTPTTDLLTKQDWICRQRVAWWLCKIVQKMHDKLNSQSLSLLASLVGPWQNFGESCILPRERTKSIGTFHRF